ncbi:MAG: carboxymuconolactone decarboxylase family protein [Dichotomicrobium sp.]
MTKQFLVSAMMAVAMLLAPTSAINAQEAPAFIKNTFPEQGIGPAWEEFQAVMGPDTALSPKVKELIGLAVAAQVPCDYCVYYHTKAAKEHGASEAEIKEALASSALVRQWSTMLNGSAYDEENWREEVDAMFSGQ